MLCTMGHMQKKGKRGVHFQRWLNVNLYASYFKLVVIPYITEESKMVSGLSSQIDSLEKYYQKQAPKNETYQTKHI